jgi:hypothetical protein
MLEPGAPSDELSRHIGVVVETDLVVGQKAREVLRRKCIAVDGDRRIVGTAYASENRRELLVAVNEDGPHGGDASPLRAVLQLTYVVRGNAVQLAQTA